MSLINDALKKAARQRAEEQADLTPLMPGGGGSRARHGGPMRTQTMVLIGAAAVALVVVTVVLTGAFVTSKPEPKAAAPVSVPAASRPAEAASVSVQPSAIAVVVPRIAEPTPIPTAVPTVAPTVAPVVVAQPTPSTVIAAPAPAAPAVSSESHTEQVQAYVDGLHVTGARSAGTDSKALVDGHVFKLNDLVNKAFGLRLSRVDADQLTFVDATGATYVRSY